MFRCKAYLLFVALPLLVLMAGCGGGGGGGSLDPSSSAPTDAFTSAAEMSTAAVDPTGTPAISSTNPYRGATNQSVNRRIYATFNQEMDASTVTTGTFTVRQGGTPVAGTVTYAQRSAIFSPGSNLARTPSSRLT